MMCDKFELILQYFVFRIKMSECSPVHDKNILIRFSVSGKTDFAIIYIKVFGRDDRYRSGITVVVPLKVQF